LSSLGRWGLGAGVVLFFSLIARGPTSVGEEPEPPVLVLLPGSAEVEGWNVVEDSLTYCATPDSLPDIYDGGYQDYVDAGVKQAVVQAYSSGESLILAYIHEMGSPEQAKAIGEEFRKSLEDGSESVKALEMKDGAFIYLGGGQSAGYLWHGPFYCNVVALGEEEAQQDAVEEFLTLLGKKATHYLNEDEESEEAGSGGGECQGDESPQAQEGGE